VGTSYETVLVVADLPRVRAALEARKVDAWLMPAGADRTAVIPREGEYSYADPCRLAKTLSADLHTAALSNEVFDSDVVTLTAFRDGEQVHRFVSAQEIGLEWIVDDSGPATVVGFVLDGIEYSLDTVEAPSGPSGAEPEPLAAFGVGTVDRARLGAVLRGEFPEDERLFAEDWHAMILEAMNLDQRGLTIAFRWVRPADLAGVVRVGSTTAVPVIAGSTSVGVVVLTGLPADADPTDVGQLLADVVVQAPFPMRAVVGRMTVLPGAATPPELIAISMDLEGVPQEATYFVALYVPTDTDEPDIDAVVEAATALWTRALHARLGLRDGQGPAVLTVSAEEFDVGFSAAVEYAESRVTP
jgi:hypothetical protein